MPASDTYYDVAMRRLDEQMTRVGALDTKAAAVLASSGTLLPVFGALLAAFVQDPTPGALSLFGAAFVIYVFVVQRVLWGTRVGDWDNRPDLALLEQYAETKDGETVRTWVADECRRAVTTNEPRLKAKAEAVGDALIALAIVAGLLAAAAAVQLLA